MNSITVCTNGRDIVESADKGMKVFDTGQFDFYFVSEFSPLRTRSSFKQFLYCGSKVLGVVQSTKCVVLK